MSMKLIREENHAVNVTVEMNESTGSKKWYIEGVFAEQEQKNRNGRIYPKKILEREMKKYQNIIAEKQAYGEVDHPERPTVLAKEAAIRMVELKQKGDDWYGKALVLEGTSGGDHIIALLKNDCKVGVSTRGTGSVKMNEGTAIVQEDYRLACWDVVLNPSANKAYVNGILESKDFKEDSNGMIVECTTQVQKESDIQENSEIISESEQLEKIEKLFSTFKL